MQLIQECDHVSPAPRPCKCFCGLSSLLTSCILHSSTFVWYFKLIRFFVFCFFFSLSLASNLLYGRKSLRGLFKRLKRKHSVWFSRMFIHFMRKKKKCFHWRHILWVLHVIIWMHLLWMFITGFYTWFLTGIVVKIETFPSFKMFSDVL